MKMRHRIPILVVVLAMAGCGGRGERPAEQGREELQRGFAAVRGLTGEERERKLLELAKAEGGQLSVYTSLTRRTERAIADAFERTYPDIDMSVYRATGEAVAQRVSQEARAHHRGADAVETNGSEMAGLAGLGIFVPYRPPGAKRLRPGSVYRDWTATRFNKFVVSWNTSLVPPGGQPKSWEDLADGRWRGRLALEESDADWYKSLREYWVDEEGKSPAQADRLFEQIARNARVVDSHAVMAELLGAGEYAVAGASYIHYTRDAREEGAPVAFTPLVEPVFSRAQGIGLLETARHPAAAILYVDWLVGDGQEVLLRNNVDPARRDLATEGGREIPVDVEAYVARAAEWNDRYERLLRLAR